MCTPAGRLPWKREKGRQPCNLEDVTLLTGATNGDILYDCIGVRCPERENPETEGGLVVVGRGGLRSNS